VLADAAHLYAPRPAYLLDGGGFGGGGNVSVGRNPPNGRLFYSLATAPDSSTTVKLEFLDAAGAVVRSVSNTEGTGNAKLSPKAGINSWTWDLRRAAPTSLTGVVLFGAPNGGARVLPGTYTVRLTVGSDTQTRTMEVRQDPRRVTPLAQVAEQDSISRLLIDRIGEIHDAVLRIRDLKSQVQGFVTRTKDADSAKAIGDMGGAIVKKIESLDPRMTTKASNGQDIINYANGINGQYGFLLGEVEGNPVVTRQAKQRLAEIETLWAALRAEVEAVERDDIEAFNRLLQAAGIEGIVVKKPKTVM